MSSSSAKNQGSLPTSEFQNFLDRSEIRFIGLAQSPVLEEFLGRCSHLSEDELSGLFNLVLTSLRHTARQDQETLQHLGLKNSEQDIDSFLRTHLVSENDEAMTQTAPLS